MFELDGNPWASSGFQRDLVMTQTVKSVFDCLVYVLLIITQVIFIFVGPYNSIYKIDKTYFQIVDYTFLALLFGGIIIGLLKSCTYCDYGDN